MNETRNQWVDVDASALASNVATFRRRVGEQVLLAPVVKSNGYGHGLERAARAFRSGGADWLCVHSFDEAQRVLALDLGVTVLVLGPLAREEFTGAVLRGLHLTVSEFDQLERAAAAAREAGRVALLHLKIETGTHRQGALEAEWGAMLERIRDCDELELVGMHSHFANIEDTTRHEFATSQVAAFERALSLAQDRGCVPRIRHIGSSAAALLFPHTHYDLVRPGIAAYGYWPSRETLVSARSMGVEGLALRRALTWKTRITQLKDAQAGDFVGYGCTQRLERDTRIAVIPVGYADGYRRAYSSVAHVLVGGRRCPVLGRVCMNLTMIDVGHVDAAELNGEVVLLGAQGDEEITAETLAGWAATIPYEVLVSIAAHVPRVGAA